MSVLSFLVFLFLRISHEEKIKQKAQNTQCTPSEPGLLPAPLLSHRLHHIYPISGLPLLSDLSSNSPSCLASTWFHQACGFSPQPSQTLLCSDSSCHFLTNLFPSCCLFTDSTFPPQNRGSVLSKKLKGTREEGVLENNRTEYNGLGILLVLLCDTDKRVTSLATCVVMSKVPARNDPQACHMVSISLWARPDSRLHTVIERGSCLVFPEGALTTANFSSSCFEGKVCLRIATVQSKANAEP